MEEGGNFIEQISESSPPESFPHSSSSDASLTDDLALTINHLISRGKPIFVLTSAKNISTAEEFSRQEMLKQKILSYNRKEKSLEELSKKFIENFEGRDGLILELDKVTVQLKVERRRIYDIVNIFESLQVVKKAAKNNYVWRGLKEAIQTISSISQSECDFSVITSKREKSLQNLAARFLKLFIFSSKPISLEEAAKILIHTEDSALIKTKIRRLYDIVNVFKSIGLVHKVHLPTKKPGFEWLGIKALTEIIQEKKEKCSQLILSKLERHDERENRQVLANRENVNDWFSYEQHKCLVELGFSSKFSPKLFQPSILKKSLTTCTLAGSLESMSDICAQY